MPSRCRWSLFDTQVQVQVVSIIFFKHTGPGPGGLHYLFNTHVKVQVQVQVVSIIFLIIRSTSRSRQSASFSISQICEILMVWRSWVVSVGCMYSSLKRKLKRPHPQRSKDPRTAEENSPLMSTNASPLIVGWLKKTLSSLKAASWHVVSTLILLKLQKNTGRSVGRRASQGFYGPLVKPPSVAFQEISKPRVSWSSRTIILSPTQQQIRLCEKNCQRGGPDCFGSNSI